MVHDTDDTCQQASEWCQILVAGHVGGLAAGLMLGSGMCPLFEIEHEGGDKSKPGSVKDRVSTQQRIATAASFAVALSLLYVNGLSQSISTGSIQV